VNNAVQYLWLELYKRARPLCSAALRIVNNRKWHILHVKVAERAILIVVGYAYSLVGKASQDAVLLVVILGCDKHDSQTLRQVVACALEFGEGIDAGLALGMNKD
jgi:hypothetical protein